MAIRSKKLRLYAAWLQSTWLRALCLFTIAAIFYGNILAPQTFLDPDAFYHISITQRMIEQQWVITDFQWLPFTTLSDAYVDHHLLYHILLIPFFLLAGPLAGMKSATVVLGAGVIALVYVLVKHAGVRYAAFWSLLLLFSYDYSFRMSLSKANSFSLLLLLIGWHAIVEKKLRTVGIISFLYVWAYGGFLQLFIVACVAGAYDFFHAVWRTKRFSLRIFLNALRLPAASFAGIIAGLIIHPSFPKNISFLWEQVIQIAVVNYQSTIGVGGEWYPRSVSDLFFDSTILTVLFGIALYLSIRYLHKVNRASVVSGVMALVFTALTLKSQRYIEYAIPWVVLWSALSIHTSGAWKRLSHKSLTLWHQSPFSKVVVFACISIACTALLYTGYMTTISLNKSVARGIPFTQFSGVGQWLTTHAPKASIIFHDDWDVFPMLFYHAPTFRYIAGLDPTFLYRQNEETYTQWEQITLGKKSAYLYETITQQFQATYVVVDHAHTAFTRNLKKDSRFTVVYTDADATIFSTQ